MTSRQSPVRATALILFATSALAASHVASADDNSMSRLTGESYAYFNGLDYSLGNFNVAHGAPAITRFAARKPLRGDTMIDVDHPGPAGAAEMPRTGPRVTLQNPFRNDTGQ
ncbi:MAG TPA: hypothetical protein VMB76_03250 [Casimicrobiaceae bacterium]|jgi:hypothetical protein|nr:hypothetical protein [Casimicrobiaceae bacterium]